MKNTMIFPAKFLYESIYHIIFAHFHPILTPARRSWRKQWYRSTLDTLKTNKIWMYDKCVLSLAIKFYCYLLSLVIRISQTFQTFIVYTWNRKIVYVNTAHWGEGDVIVLPPPLTTQLFVLINIYIYTRCRVRPTTSSIGEVHEYVVSIRVYDGRAFPLIKTPGARVRYGSNVTIGNIRTELNANRLRSYIENVFK